MPKRNAPDLPARQATRLPFHVASTFELRATDDTAGVLRVEGHASTFGYEYKVWGGPPFGWIERIERGAFDDTLADDPDVVFLRNHEGMPLARTKSGTLTLGTDKTGLTVAADLDLTNPEVRSLASGLERGDIDEMSFAFRVTEQTWTNHPDYEDDDEALRKITAVNLHRGDVSAVTYGASDATDIDISRSLDRLSVEQLVELRAALDERQQKPTGGTPEAEQDTGGMPGHLLELLRIH